MVCSSCDGVITYEHKTMDISRLSCLHPCFITHFVAFFIGRKKLPCIIFFITIITQILNICTKWRFNILFNKLLIQLLIQLNTISEVAKFLKATTGKSLAEVGKSKSFAIGVSLNHKNIFNTRQWPKDCNILGKCLMEIRNELNR